MILELNVTAPDDTLLAHPVAIERRLTEILSDSGSHPEEATTPPTTTVLQSVVTESAASTTADLATLSGTETARDFAALFKRRGGNARQLRRELVMLADPVALAKAALADFRRFGNADRLSLAARLLAEMGGRALPAYLWIVERPLDESETILRGLPFAEISSAKKASIIMRLHAKEQPSPRLSLDLVTTLPKETAKSVTSLWGSPRHLNATLVVGPITAA